MNTLLTDSVWWSSEGIDMYGAYAISNKYLTNTELYDGASFQEQVDMKIAIGIWIKLIGYWSLEVHTGILVDNIANLLTILWIRSWLFNIHSCSWKQNETSHLTLHTYPPKISNLPLRIPVKKPSDSEFNNSTKFDKTINRYRLLIYKEIYNFNYMISTSWDRL